MGGEGDFRVVSMQKQRKLLHALLVPSTPSITPATLAYEDGTSEILHVDTLPSGF